MIEDNKIESIVCDIYNYQTSLTSLTPNSNSVLITMILNDRMNHKITKFING